MRIRSASSASASASDLPDEDGGESPAVEGVAAGGSWDAHAHAAHTKSAVAKQAIVPGPRARRLIGSIFAFLLSFAAVLSLRLSAVVALPFALAVLGVACNDPAPAPPPHTVVDAPAVSSAPRYPTDDASWGRYHSKRFLLSFPLPDGKAWHIDDHSRPSLFAVHEATGSRVWVMTTQEDDLVNRQKCEERARALGWITSKTLTTVDDQTTIGPEAYDSRIWVALDAAKPGGELEGHVYLFGAFIRRCLLMHVSTRIASAKDEEVLSERLALARARIVRLLTIDPPRISDDATVPRDKPEIKH